MLCVCSRFIPLLVLLGAIASIGCNFPKDQDEESIHSGPLSEYGSMNAVTVGNKILFTGGQYSDGTGTVDIYDTQSRRWSTSRLSIPRHNMGTATIGTRAYFVGGIGISAQQYDVIDIYDESTKTWSVDHLSFARFDPDVLSIGNQLIVGGGFNIHNSTQIAPNTGTNSLTSIEIIDTSGSRSFATLSEPRSTMASAVLGGKAYFIGGYPCYNSYLTVCDASNTIDIYDPQTASLTTISMPHRRAAHSAVAIGAHLVIAGGGDNQSGESNTVDILDTTTNHWTTIVVPILGSESNGVSVGRYAIIAGGTTAFSTVLRYDSVTGTIDTADSFHFGRYNFGAASLDGLAYFGGGGTPLDRAQSLTVEVFNSNSLKWSLLD